MPAGLIPLIAALVALAVTVAAARAFAGALFLLCLGPDAVAATLAFHKALPNAGRLDSALALSPAPRPFALPQRQHVRRQTSEAAHV